MKKVTKELADKIAQKFFGNFIKNVKFDYVNYFEDEPKIEIEYAVGYSRLFIFQTYGLNELENFMHLDTPVAFLEIDAQLATYLTLTEEDEIVLIQPTTDEPWLHMLNFIENEENYYAMFVKVIENSDRCKQVLNTLFANRKISHEEYLGYFNRINVAREKAIKTHGEWTIKMLERSKTHHTSRTFVSSVYSDIFGIELKGEEE